MNARGPVSLKPGRRDLRRRLVRLSPRFLAQGIKLIFDMKLVATSPLFDRDWYLMQNPDVAAVGVDPLKHYLRHGGFEGRDPSPHFSSEWYLQVNPDVAEVPMNPLVHYLRWGAAEGRRPAPLLESEGPSPPNQPKELIDRQRMRALGLLTATLSPTPFTAHNIRLDDGAETFPSKGVTMDRYFVMQAAQRVLRIVFPEGLEGKTVIDVGCLEGGYTVEFARMGMNALGLEPRSSNYANCLYVKDRVNLPHLRFVQGDANDIDQFGEFDVFFVSGLLYHLDRPKTFLEKVEQNCRRLLILNTHVSHCRPTVGMRRHHLSDMAENEGLQGRWQVEYTATSLEEIDTLKWASWSNPRSFWIQKEHLLGLIKSIGFSLVFEQFDQFSDITYETTRGYYSTEDRVQIIGIKVP